MNGYVSPYSDQLTIREALAIFFEKNQLGIDGGVNDSWIKLRFGKFYIPFPNFPARRDAVKYHDIHHIICHYPTTWQGEAEIGAWEISTSCGNYFAAWFFDLGIFAIGLFLFPIAVFRGFVRGRRTQCFYHRTHTYEQILDMKIADAQTLLKLTPADHSAATVREALDFALWWVIAFVSSLLVFVAPVAFVIHLIVDC